MPIASLLSEVRRRLLFPRLFEQASKHPAFGLGFFVGAQLEPPDVSWALGIPGIYWGSLFEDWIYLDGLLPFFLLLWCFFELYSLLLPEREAG